MENENLYDIEYQSPLLINNKIELCNIGDIVLFNAPIVFKKFPIISYSNAIILKFKDDIINRKQVQRVLLAPLIRYHCDKI